jgi:hypothetical protein
MGASRQLSVRAISIHDSADFPTTSGASSAADDDNDSDNGNENGNDNDNDNVHDGNRDGNKVGPATTTAASPPLPSAEGMGASRQLNVRAISIHDSADFPTSSGVSTADADGVYDDDGEDDDDTDARVEALRRERSAAQRQTHLQNQHKLPSHLRAEPFPAAAGAAAVAKPPGSQRQASRLRPVLRAGFAAATFAQAGAQARLLSLSESEGASESTGGEGGGTGTGSGSGSGDRHISNAKSGSPGGGDESSTVDSSILEISWHTSDEEAADSAIDKLATTTEDDDER